MEKNYTTVRKNPNTLNGHKDITWIPNVGATAHP